MILVAYSSVILDVKKLESVTHLFNVPRQFLLNLIELNHLIKVLCYSDVFDRNDDWNGNTL